VIGAQQQALRKIEQTLPLFIENNTWQELCHEWLLRASANNEVPLPVEQVGSSWMRNYTFDVMGINRPERSLVLGVCSWESLPIDSSILRNLVARTPTIVPDEGEWSVYFLGFAQNSWTEDAQDFVSELARAGVIGENWRSVGVRLLNLEQVDADLISWSAAANVN
jgi:hypothetical protein